jgi:uncharacterized protein (DUF302 family)
MSYCFTKPLKLPFAQAVERVIEQFKQRGFGVLSDIDVKATLKKKLDVDVHNYRILGMCNPPNAYKALQAEPNIGIMLPCNAVVYEEGDHTVVSIVRPTVAMQAVDNEALEPIATHVEGELKAVFDALQEEGGET